MYICICGHFSLINDNCKHCMFSRFDLDLHVWIDYDRLILASHQYGFVLHPIFCRLYNPFAAICRHLSLPETEVFPIRTDYHHNIPNNVDFCWGPIPISALIVADANDDDDYDDDNNDNEYYEHYSCYRYYM